MSDGETKAESLARRHCSRCGGNLLFSAKGGECGPCLRLAAARAKCDRWGVEWCLSWRIELVQGALIEMLEEVATFSRPFPTLAALPENRLEEQAAKAFTHSQDQERAQAVAQLGEGLSRVRSLVSGDVKASSPLLSTLKALDEVDGLLARLKGLEKGGAGHAAAR